MGWTSNTSQDLYNQGRWFYAVDDPDMLFGYIGHNPLEAEQKNKIIHTEHVFP